MTDANPYEQIEPEILVNDEQYDEAQREVDVRVVSRQLPEAQHVRDFLGNERFRIDKSDSRANLWEQGGGFMRVFLQPIDASQTFALINAARRAGVNSNWTEKQHAGQDPKLIFEPACSMLDIDIYQPEQHSLLNDKQLTRFNNDAARLFITLFRTAVPNPNGAHSCTVHTAVLRKPATAYDDKHRAWKDGFQMYIYARLTRNEKRFFIHEILRAGLMTKAFGREYAPHGLDPEKFLDTQCCHVPTLVYGSCKAGGKPKPLWLVYRWEFDVDGSVIVSPDMHFLLAEKHLNFSHELSINWEARAISKRLWTVRDEHRTVVDLMSRKAAATTSETEREAIVDDLNRLLAEDPEAAYLLKVLDCLKPNWYNNHKLKFKVCYALCKTTPQYWPLAKIFMKKSHKYTDEKFGRMMVDVAAANYEGLTVDSIGFWAAADNPARYETTRDHSAFILMSTYVFDPITEGRLNHAQYAEILLTFMRSKYTTDMRKGDKQIHWFEFKTPNDPHRPGEVWKWCEVASPNNMQLYLHRKLTGLCQKMVVYITKKIDDESTKIGAALAAGASAKAGGPGAGQIDHLKAVRTHYTKILTGFKSSARKLGESGFKAGVITQASIVFERPGFMDTLDHGVMDMGVGNGILQLSPSGRLPKLIKSYNALRVSRFTKTPYVQFNPRDPLTRKILRTLRAMHPDNETDAFEYLNSAFACSLDYRTREALLFMLTGPGANGKTSRVEAHQFAMDIMYCAQMRVSLILHQKEAASESATSALMKLEAARSATYEEPPSCAILNMATVKRITGCSTLSGRDLYQTERQFETRCIHFSVSNHDFIIQTHEEAIWRRLRYIWLSLIFRDTAKFDPSNPKHRLADPTINPEFWKDEAVRIAYIGIMTFFHMKLMRNWGGKIENIPHPTIDAHTNAFRNRQDTLNRFITERIVVSTAVTVMTPLQKIIDSYCYWYDHNVREARHNKEDIHKQLLDSALKNVLESTTTGWYMRAGFRVVEDLADLQQDEHPFNTGSTVYQSVTYSYTFAPETPDTYLDRVEHEWDEMMAEEQAEAVIDLSGTYSYESEDEGMEDDDLIRASAPTTAADFARAEETICASDESVAAAAALEVY